MLDTCTVYSTRTHIVSLIFCHFFKDDQEYIICYKGWFLLGTYLNNEYDNLIQGNAK